MRIFHDFVVLILWKRCW